MLRKHTEEYEASLAKGSPGGNEIAKSTSTIQDGTSNSLPNAGSNYDNSEKISGEMCFVVDEVPEEAEEAVPVQEEAIYLGRPRVISNISDNPFETVREICLVQADVSANTVEICDRREELQGVSDSRSDFGDQAAIVEHDYVQACCENAEDSSSMMSKHSESSAIVVKKIVLPVRELSSRHRTVRPLLNPASSDAPYHAPIRKCKFSNSGSMNSDPTHSGVPSGNSSVLRTLLQASRKQLKLYQSHNHTSERLRSSPSSISATETSAVTAPKVRKKDFECQADIIVTAPHITPNPEIHAGAGAQEYEQSQSGVDGRSQIKALLLGQSYDRQPQSETLGMGWDTDQQAKKQVRMQEHELPGFLCDVVDVVSEYKDLSYSVQCSHNKSRSIEVRRKGLYGVPYPGMTPAQVMIEESGTAHFFTLIKLVFSVLCKDEDGQLTPDPLLELLQKLSIKGGHVFCPGVEAELASVAPNTKNLMVYELLEPRYQAHDCPIWHMLGSNQSWFPLNEGVHKCKPCKCLERYLRTLGKAKERKEVMPFS